MKIHENNVDGSADHFKIACSTNGASTISTVDAFAMGANLTIDPDGQLILNGSGIPNAIKCEDPLYLKEAANSNSDIATHGQLWVKNSDPNELMYTDGDGKDMAISNMVRYAYAKWNYRMASVNNWYAGFFLHMGTSVAAADFVTTNYTGVIFNPKTACQIKQFNILVSVSSTEPYEMEFWDCTFVDGDAGADTATQIGSTVQLNSGSNLTASRWYSQAVSVNYDIDAGHVVFMVARYTDGSGNKVIYWNITSEFVETS